MINPEQSLAPDIFDKPAMASTREGFGTGSVEAGERDSRVVVLSADLAESTQAHRFAARFPERFVQVGVAEQNLATVAAGMANYGKIPFFTSYATFSPGRNWEQIRTTIAINNLSAKICGMHAGVSVGPDGATHQALEDIALMRVLPHLTVLYPCDSEEGRKATLAAAQLPGPVYLRFAREKSPVLTTAHTPFAIGKANVLWQSEQPSVAVFSTGPLTYQALVAARALESEGVSVSVTHVHTIKPLDKDTLIREAKRAGAVVTVEEHQVAGGFGGAVAELLAAECPLPIEFIGAHDCFGQSGKPDELIEHYGMGASAIAEAVKKAKTRRRV
jgi:transketolase